ncbi:hypothetical protein TNCV_4313731 [Trichonephila clavipes]|nr:hypothetical protein TNCV_4313731 [Trichonephila clavipes]
MVPYERLCVDFRALNSESVSDDFPMEDAVELIHSIGRANIITTLDLLKGYWLYPWLKTAKILHLSRLIGNSTVSKMFSCIKKICFDDDVVPMLGPSQTVPWVHMTVGE